MEAFNPGRLLAMHAIAAFLLCLTWSTQARRVQSVKGGLYEQAVRTAGSPDPLNSLAALLMAFNRPTSWPAARGRPHTLNGPLGAATASPATMNSYDVQSNAASLSTIPAPSDTENTKGPHLKKLEQNVISCSVSAYLSGRFGSQNRYANGKQACLDAVERLESEFEDSEVDLDNLQGRWRLIFTNDAVTRSSPFFWVVKELFETDTASFFRDRSTRNKREEPSRDILSSAFFGTLDTMGLLGGVAFGDAYQTIEGNELISEVEVKSNVGLVVVTTSSRWKPSQDGSLEITVDTTQAAKSDFDQLLPDFLPEFARVENVKFPSGVMFESIKPGGSTVWAKQSYLSDDLRVTRHEENVYVYRKVTESIR